jgi:hypothetical protein
MHGLGEDALVGGLSLPLATTNQLHQHLAGAATSGMSGFLVLNASAFSFD